MVWKQFTKPIGAGANMDKAIKLLTALDDYELAVRRHESHKYQDLELCADPDWHGKRLQVTGVALQLAKNTNDIPTPRYSPPGEISRDGCWTISSEGYLYTADTLHDVIQLFFTEYQEDNHLVG
jgi:hypothetical protein